MDHLSGLSWAIVRRRRHLDHWLLKLLELLPWHLTSSWNCHHNLMKINAELGTNIRITQLFIGLPFTWTQILCLILLSHRLYWQLQSSILVFSCCVIYFLCIVFCYVSIIYRQSEVGTLFPGQTASAQTPCPRAAAGSQRGAPWWCSAWRSCHSHCYSPAICNNRQVEKWYKLRNCFPSVVRASSIAIASIKLR